MNGRTLLALAVVGAGVAACEAEAGPLDRAPLAKTETVAVAQTRALSPSCEGRPARDVRLSRDVEPILMSACSGEFCHRLTTPSRAYAFLVNQASVECDDARPLVTPGDPDRSYVVDKILGRNLCAGHPMPRGFENRLSADEIATVTDWICEGAPRD